MRIADNVRQCTVMVTVDGEDESMEFVLEHASAGLEKFSTFDGFLAGATHVSEDRKRVIQYLQWESVQSHEACMNDPSWDADPSGSRFLDLMGTGAIRVDVHVYEVVKVKEK